MRAAKELLDLEGRLYSLELRLYDLERQRAKYWEILNEVKTKVPGETRHDTALRRVAAVEELQNEETDI